MSTSYNLEPPPTAKALLHTTSGEILLELFAKQTPLASRNFLQHCLDGYYNGTIFHRLVPGFVLQGGDPSGTGDGGEAIYPAGTFLDEFHSRLKFNRRGLLGMANSGRKDDNGSQFFITLGKAEELNGKNTMFGRVEAEGKTIFNVMKMAEAELVEVEGSERPLYPTTVTGAEVLVNPFEDMAPRKLAARPTTLPKEEPKVKKTKKRTGKALLSFGGEEEGDVAEPLPKKAKFNTDLVSTSTKSNKDASKDARKDGKKPVRQARPTREQPLSPTVSPKLNARPETQLPLPNEEGSSSSSRSSSPDTVPNGHNKDFSALERTKAQIAELKASIRRDAGVQPEQKAQKRSALEEMIPTNSIRGRKRTQGNRGGSSSKDERRTMKALDAFRAKLEQAAPESKAPAATADGALNGDKQLAAAAAEGDDDEEAKLCDLHFILDCQSCKTWDDQGGEGGESDDDGKDWMAHALSFEKDRLGKDLTWKRKNEEELVVIDPREKAKDIKEEKKARRHGKEGSSRAWDRDRDRGRLPERTSGAKG